MGKELLEGTLFSVGVARKLARVACADDVAFGSYYDGSNAVALGGSGCLFGVMQGLAEVFEMLGGGEVGHGWLASFL